MHHGVKYSSICAMNVAMCSVGFELPLEGFQTGESGTFGDMFLNLSGERASCVKINLLDLLPSFNFSPQILDILVPFM